MLLKQLHSIRKPIWTWYRGFNSFIIKQNRVECDVHLEEMMKKVKTISEKSTLKTYNFKDLSICLYSNRNLDKLMDYYVHLNGENSSFLVGRVNNEAVLRTKISDYENCQNLKGAKLISHLVSEYGTSAFNMIEGSYCFITINHRNGSIETYSDSIGLMPTYFANQLGSAWIFNEAKVFAANPLANLKLKPFSDLDLGSLDHPSDFTCFENIFKVPKGFGLKMDRDGNANVNGNYFELKPSHYSNKNIQNKLEFFQDSLRKILDNSIKNSLNESKEPCLLLSGGLDSSLITAMARPHVQNLTTISVGTQYSNEFKWAKMVSDFVGTHHHELVLDDEKVINGIIRSSYENEIFDGFSAEVQSPLYNLMEYVKSLNGNKVLTGYGADLLFGGIIPLDTDVNLVNKILDEQIKRTRWTGEFSPFIGDKFGITVEHPFWNKNLISFAISLDGEYKKNAKEVKIILREMAQKFQYLPKDIVWRKKLGINEAASINHVFSKYLGLASEIKKNDYRLKSLFIYNVFKEMFENKQPPESLDISAVAKKTSDHFNSYPQSKNYNGLIDVQIKDKIMIVSFVHPNRHNPLGYEMRKYLKEIFKMADSNSEVDAIVLTGGIGRSFSAGGDFNEVKNLDSAEKVNSFIDDIYDFYISALKISKPTVAAVDNHAIGIGFQLALCCDIRIGTTRCSFTLPELKHGLSCTVGSCMLHHCFGHLFSTKTIYECEPIESKELIESKMVSSLVEPDDLVDQAFEMAKIYAKYPKNAFKNTKISTNKRFIKALEDSIEDSKVAHRSSLLSKENEKHFKNILKDKY
ncbi:spore coat [Brachionus plicatilis]|uniref:Spore coat n=1 Tax=Brachionus plicatilis TaxID=10195 RepID=A0A3M7PSN8_BRAPC|nr:spore coat [Brachionus plicatilis]